MKLSVTGRLEVLSTGCEAVLVCEARVGSVPYSNHALVSRPLAVTLPFRVALNIPAEVAARVVASGAELLKIPDQSKIYIPAPTHFSIMPLSTSWALPTGGHRSLPFIPS